MQNPLEEFFESRKPTDRGIWKWKHYFPIYHRHLARFRSQPVTMLEIGVYGGGSLDMWRSYFNDPGFRNVSGRPASIHGVDINPDCAKYAGDGVTIHTGDQASVQFWANFVKDVPPLDIVIDDGGHMGIQQVASWDALRGHMKRGGVYIVEDVEPNEFLRTAINTGYSLQPQTSFSRDETNDERSIVLRATVPQRSIGSIHIYPGMVVIERTPHVVEEFVASRKGLLP